MAQSPTKRQKGAPHSPQGDAFQAPSESVATFTKGVWRWNFDRSSLDEKKAAKSVGCGHHDYCWILAAVSRLPTEPGVLCPFLGGNSPDGTDHTDMSSPIHVKTLAIREDEAWRRRLMRCVVRRKLTPAEKQQGKPFSNNVTGDGPSVSPMPELVSLRSKPAGVHPLPSSTQLSGRAGVVAPEWPDHSGAVEHGLPSAQPPSARATPGSHTDNALTLVELYAGICAFSFAFSCMLLQPHLQAFTELPGQAAAYASTMYGASSLGPTQTADFSHLHPKVVSVTFECAPYTVAGLQKFGTDPRAEQVDHSVHAILHMLPLFFVLENVQEFFSQDSHPKHGMYSKFVAGLATQYAMTSPVFIHDASAGGSLHRTRGFIFAEFKDPSKAMPTWHVQQPAATPTCASSLLQPINDIPQSYIPTGTYKRHKVVTASTSQLKPMVVGEFWWGDHSTPLQPGVIVRWRGSLYKVDDPAKSNPAVVRLIKQQPRGVKRHEQLYVRAARISREMHVGKWYPVFTPFAPLKSPRTWGQMPEGNMCLIEDISTCPPTVRRLTPYEPSSTSS